MCWTAKAGSSEFAFLTDRAAALAKVSASQQKSRCHARNPCIPAPGRRRPPGRSLGQRLRDHHGAARTRCHRGSLGRARTRGARVHPGRALRPLHPGRVGTHGGAARPAVADHRRVHARGCPRHGWRRAAACAQAQRLWPLRDRACRDRAVRAAVACGTSAPRPYDLARCATHPAGPAWDLHADDRTRQVCFERHGRDADADPVPEPLATEAVQTFPLAGGQP